jgi:DNA-binding NarL/FixJ family response regulator
MSTNRVLLITEEAVLATGLAALLRSSSTLELETRIGIPASIADLVRSTDPHVLLFDFIPQDYPLLLQLRSDVPTCRIVLWMRSVPVEIGCQAMRLGVRGILRKTEPVDLLMKCLDAVATGEFWFDKELTAGFLESRTVELTPRESQIVPLVTQGLKNKEIAFELQIAEATVRIYLSALFRKLGVKDRYELAIYGIKNLLPSRSPSKDAGSDQSGNKVTAESTGMNRLRLMVLDKPAAAPAGNPPRGPYRAMRAVAGRAGK